MTIRRRLPTSPRKPRGNVTGVLIVKLKVGHRGRSSIRLRIFDPCEDPFPRGFLGDVGKRRRIVIRLHHVAVRLRHKVAMYASHTGEQMPPFVETGSTRQRAEMALPAGAA